ncbi:MAG: nucleotidyltransferase family protein [Deltaproteobacteria bacterium]|nr:nucleotidyltransferase family protein [Deltaproteobacteria bacterium]
MALGQESSSQPVRDLDALLGLLARERLPEEVPDRVLAAAERAGVLDLLAEDGRFRERLGPRAGAYLMNAAVGALRLSELGRIAAALDAAGIRAAPLKGMSYALLFERGGPLRPMADTDILVPERDYARAAAVLESLGYRPFELNPMFRARDFHECALHNGKLLVEIHRYFLPPLRLDVDYDALWARCERCEIEPSGAIRALSPGAPHRLASGNGRGAMCYLLCPDDMLVYHCLHMGAHEFVLGGLRALVDLVRLLGREGLSMETASARARAWGCAKMCWCALGLAETCFPGSVAVRDRARFSPGPVAARALERFVIGPAVEALTEPGLLPRAEQLFRKALLVDRVDFGLRYLAWYLRERIRILVPGS